MVGRQRRKAREAFRMERNRGMQTVVRSRRPGHRVIRPQSLRARRTMRDHLNVDPRLIHLLDSPGAEILHPLDQRIAWPCGVMNGIEMIVPIGIEIVFLECDDHQLSRSVVYELASVALARAAAGRSPETPGASASAAATACGQSGAS